MKNNNLTKEEKEWVESRSKRLNNYFIFKIGLFAIAGVYAVADFVNVGLILRILYVLIIIGLIGYIYLYIDSKKYLHFVNRLLKE